MESAFPNELSAYYSKFFDGIISFLKRVLPTSPFRQYLRGYVNGESGLLKAVNYFVPIDTFIIITLTWVTAMFLWYLYHGLISKIWYSNDKKNLKEKAVWITKVINFFGKLIGKL